MAGITSMVPGMYKPRRVWKIPLHVDGQEGGILPLRFRVAVHFGLLLLCVIREARSGDHEVSG